MQLLVSRSVLSHPHTRTNILLSCSSWNKCFFIFVSWLLLLGLAQNKTLNGAGKRVEACGFMQGTRDQIRNFHRGDKRVSIGHSRDRITRSHFAEVCN